MAETDLAIARALDMSATSVQNMTSMMQGMTRQNQFNNLPVYDGQGISLRDFLQDVQNLPVSVLATEESNTSPSLLANYAARCAIACTGCGLIRSLIL